MKGKLVVWLVVVVIAGLAYAGAQEPSGKIPKKHVPAVAKGPVTQAEAKVTFDHVVACLETVTKKHIAFAPSTLKPTSKPVTREQVLLEMNRLYKATQPYFKVTPKALWYDASLLTIKKGTQARPILETLIKEGFVSRVCPLSTSKEDTMTIEDFGDTVGVFVSRTADLAHMPTPRFSPYIENPTGPVG